MKVKILLGFLTLSIFFISCEEDPYKFTAINCEDMGLIANTSIQTIKELYSYGGPVLIEDDLILEGYVVSSDRSGNFYKSLSIQNKPENPTAAISIAVDASNLYNKFELGRKVFVKLKGLAIGSGFGRIQIGQINNGDLVGVSSFEYEKHLVRSCEIAELSPYEVLFSELGASHLDMFISFSNAQFQESESGNSFADPNSNQSIDRVFNVYDSNCDKLGSLKIKTSGFSDFGNYTIPEGRGTIQGVLQNYYSDLQLILRDENDVQFDQEYCNEIPWEVNASIKEIRELYKGTMVEFGNSEGIIIEGFVVSSDLEGNFRKRLVIQDKLENPTSGIQILIDDSQLSESYKIGERLVVRLNNLYMDTYKGRLSLGIHDNGKVAAIKLDDKDDFVFGTKEIHEVVPKLIAMDEITKKDNQGVLVKMESVQLDSLELGKAFAFFSGDDDGYRTLVQCTSFKSVQLFTEGTADFANNSFSTGNGQITAVLESVLELRSPDDVKFDNFYEDCKLPIPPILITEVADPINSVGARFVELYNAGDTPIDLKHWKLEKYVNGSQNVSSEGVDLSSIEIAPKSFAVIANEDFEMVFGKAPTIVSSYISGNGDDVYRLVNSGGKTIDIYGVIGEDGSGKNWEYLDGGAVRKTSVNLPNEKFDFKEWIISSKSNNFSINHPNTPKYAPKDYLPFFE